LGLQAEILNLTYAGILVGTILLVVGLAYGVNNAWRKWRQNRADEKEVRKAAKTFRERYEWKSHMINGVDFGEWVRKDLGRGQAASPRHVDEAC
jgi:hypothetical protein